LKFISTLIQKLANGHVLAFGFMPQNWQMLVAGLSMSCLVPFLISSPVTLPYLVMANPG
jgi:hypothetical protein